jgi:orotate phosphoribosyltransferase
VDAEVSTLARPRRGHFDLGTGFHGDLWLDLDALFLRPALLRPHVRLLADRLREHQVDAVCGPAEGGALLAYAIADQLGVAFLAANRAPRAGQANATEYRLADVSEVGGGISGWRVAIADDAVNAGTAVLACAGLLRDRGAIPVAVAALLAVGLASGVDGGSAGGPDEALASGVAGGAVAAALSVPFHAAGVVASQAWPAARCPLCAESVPLTDPGPGD